MKPSEAAVFLDRDGTVIADYGYLEDPAEVELLPGAGSALQALRRRGFRLVLITNQSGIGRGYFERDAVELQHARLAELLQEYGVKLDAVSLCPHAPDDDCECRKPSPKMLKTTAGQLNIDLSRSYMVGDKPSDVEAGLAAGCKSVLVGSRADERARHHALDLPAAVDWILADSAPPGD